MRIHPFSTFSTILSLLVTIGSRLGGLYAVSEPDYLDPNWLLPPAPHVRKTKKKTTPHAKPRAQYLKPSDLLGSRVSSQPSHRQHARSKKVDYFLNLPPARKVPLLNPRTTRIAENPNRAHPANLTSSLFNCEPTPIVITPTTAKTTAPVTLIQKLESNRFNGFNP